MTALTREEFIALVFAVANSPGAGMDYWRAEQAVVQVLKAVKHPTILAAIDTSAVMSWLKADLSFDSFVRQNRKMTAGLWIEFPDLMKALEEIDTAQEKLKQLAISKKEQT